MTDIITQNFLATLKNEGYFEVNKFAPTLYLWTRRDAARHAKMLNTEKALEVFEKLEEFYFNYEKFHWQHSRLDSKISSERLTPLQIC